MPVHITGGFADPNIQVDNSLFLRGGAAILLGLINPLAALLPLINLGDDKAGQCSELLAKAQTPTAAK